MTLADVKNFVPHSLREPLGRAIKNAQDQYWLASFGRHAGLVPPVELMHDGPQSYKDFKENGVEFLRYYVELCGLQPTEKILDVGSGIGRKTWPLAGYLNDRGSYDGLELVKSAVEWCTEKYTSKYPNFRFQQIDVYNAHYNPEGKYPAAEYRFPFRDEEFDFVVLNSVFTHMLPAEVENYLREVARVLKRGGRCLISFFLLTEESIKLLDEDKSMIVLPHAQTPVRMQSREKPEEAIGFEEEYVIELYERCGLEITGPIRYGYWCGRTQYLSCQDLIVATKKSS
jgi:SAM-dependent methyltransferase